MNVLIYVDKERIDDVGKAIEAVIPGYEARLAFVILGNASLEEETLRAAISAIEAGASDYGKF